jgi:hypothetical protein
MLKENAGAATQSDIPLRKSRTGRRRPEEPTVRRIASIESLRDHLQWAIELEHFTDCRQDGL